MCFENILYLLLKVRKLNMLVAASVFQQSIFDNSLVYNTCDTLGKLICGDQVNYPECCFMSTVRNRDDTKCQPLCSDQLVHNLLFLLHSLLSTVYSVAPQQSTNIHFYWYLFLLYALKEGS